jgi:hypothetical protein
MEVLGSSAAQRSQIAVEMTQPVETTTPAGIHTRRAISSVDDGCYTSHHSHPSDRRYVGQQNPMMNCELSLK